MAHAVFARSSVSTLSTSGDSSTMRKYTAFLTSLALGTAVAAAPALAQPAPAAAPAGVTRTPGTTVYDSEGQAIGPIDSSDGATVVVTVGDRPAALPASAFMQTDKGTAITLTLAQLNAALDQQAAAADAQLTAALQPGADIKGVNGASVVGKVKTADAEGVVVTTAGGDVRLPRKAFFVAAHGLSTSFSAEQFAAAVAEATTPDTDATDDAAADTGAAADAEPVAKPAD
jgi:hypothetical protein